MSDGRCSCGRPMIARTGDLEPTCGECRSKADSCACEPLQVPVETKEEERTKSVGPAVPSADPVMFAGVLGDITAAAEPDDRG